MDIASFNVNSVRARITNVCDWLRDKSPDIVCLQEIKTVDENFPSEFFEELGYNIAVYGQKSYNGVAILSKLPFEEIIKGLPNDESSDENDDQARYLEVVVSGKKPIRVASIYLPNGNPVMLDGEISEKYKYKLDWLERLHNHATDLLALEEALILAGDYNVIPDEEAVYDPALWAGDALFLPETLAAYRKLLWLGLYNAYDVTDGRPHQYTYWDYQAGARQKNHGIRIDHLLCSAQAIDRIKSVRIDDYVRDKPKPSDHVPIVGSFDL